MLKGERAFLREMFVRRKYRALQFILDLVAIVGAWRASIELRLVLNHLFALQITRPELLALAPPLFGVLGIWISASLWLKLYEPATGPFTGAFGLRALESAAVAGVSDIVATFFGRQLGASLSRSLVLVFLPLSCVLLAISRFLASRLVLFIETRWPDVERVAMLGCGRELHDLVDGLQYAWRSPFDLVGVIVPESATLEASAATSSFPILGTTRQLAELINRERLERILVADRSLPRRELRQCSRISQRMGVTLSRPIAPARVPARIELAARSGLQLLETKPMQFRKHEEAMKRVADILIGGICLAALSPLVLLFAALIKITSPGAVFYRSRRVGRGGRHFDFLKFRSMYQNSPKSQIAHLNEREGHLFKVRNDPRVTPLGRFMRRYSIDELPQLLNVLRGDMSLVGPRPLPAEDLDPDGHSKRFRAWGEQRSKVLPGITGLWQVRGRSDLPFDEMTQLDIYYIRHWSLALDFRILLETPLVVLTGRGAY
jgi:exopolysaccharide biosynthesis polyprenyl glycosylphosphotransferase